MCECLRKLCLALFFWPCTKTLRFLPKVVCIPFPLHFMGWSASCLFCCVFWRTLAHPVCVVFRLNGPECTISLHCYTKETLCLFVRLMVFVKGREGGREGGRAGWAGERGDHTDAAHRWCCLDFFVSPDLKCQEIICIGDAPSLLIAAFDVPPNVSWLHWCDD